MNKSFFVMAISAMFFISCSNKETNVIAVDEPQACLLYTSDAADD